MAGWGAAAAAALDLIGGERANNATASQNREARAFNERMSNTAYVRGMADMRNAGLNPILAYKQGPASAPTSVGVQQQNTLGSAARTGLKGYTDVATARNIQEDTELKRATTQKTQAETRIKIQEANREEKSGKGTPAQYLDTIEKVIQRLYDKLKRNSAKDGGPSKDEIRRALRKGVRLKPTSRSKVHTLPRDRAPTFGPRYNPDHIY